MRALRELCPDLHISVDGGVNAKLAPELLRAGANVLVAGGACEARGGGGHGCAIWLNFGSTGAADEFAGLGGTEVPACAKSNR